MIADISHDLKTPITAISGYAEAILSGKIKKEEERRYLEVISARSKDLVSLINAFHEYSKVDHPKFKLQLECIDIAEFMRDYLAKKYDEIDLQGFNLEVEIPDERVYADIDEFQFSRVLDNLISNIFKHNTIGTIIYVNLMVKETYLEIQLADNGLGIPEEYRDKIFEPFVVVDESRPSRGSGLGLSIVKKIVELHRGSIVLSKETKQDIGTEYIITLPREI